MVAKRLSRRTITERLGTVRHLAAHAGKPPRLVGPVEIIDWMANGWRSPARRSRKKPAPWKSSSAHTYYTHLTAWYTWLHTQEHIDRNPMVKVPVPKRSKGKPHPVRDEHIGALLGVGMWQSTRVMILLGLCQGMRAEEIAHMRGEWIDHVGGTLSVTGKGGKTRVIPLHHRIADMAAWMPAKGFWFPSPTRPGKSVRADSVSVTIARVFNRAGVEGSAHWLRHWLATALHRAGVDIMIIRDILGHESVATTEIYTLTDIEEACAALELVDPLRIVPRPSRDGRPPAPAIGPSPQKRTSSNAQRTYRRTNHAA